MIPARHHFGEPLAYRMDEGCSSTEAGSVNRLTRTGSNKEGALPEPFRPGRPRHRAGFTPLAESQTAATTKVATGRRKGPKRMALLKQDRPSLVDCSKFLPKP